jgi:formiminoglutamase
VNAINFDAHSDFRILEGRHSEMDFHMLMKKAFLKKYFIFDYMKTIPQKCFRPYQKKRMIRYNTYDSIGIRKEKSLAKRWQVPLNL